MVWKKKPNKRASGSGEQEGMIEAVGPLPLVKTRLKHLPSSGEVWQADFRPMPVGIVGSKPDARPYFVLVASETTHLVLAYEVLGELPSDTFLWDVVARAVQEPLAGEPARPAVLRVRDDPAWTRLRVHFKDCDIPLEFGAPMTLLDTVFDDLVTSLAPSPEPEATPLLEIPGVGLDQAGSFYDAAAFFFQRKPWKKLSEGERAIQVRSPQFDGGPWYAVIMGAAGVTRGLAVYDDIDFLARAWAGEFSDREQVQDTVATAVTYGTRDEMHPEDVKAIKKHRWKLAGSKAYPEVYHTDRGMVMRSPTAPELRLLDACLRAVPLLVEKRRQDDDTPEEITVQTPSGPAAVTLSWVQV